jgi:IS1 family transposase
MTDKPPRFSAETKAQAVDMYLNNVGIRKIARFACRGAALDPQGACPFASAHAPHRATLCGCASGHHQDGRDLHLRPKKQQRAVIWTAFSRRQGRVVAYHIGDKGVASAIAIYQLARQAVGNIAVIYTDANSCYRLAFTRHGVPEPHHQTKAQTHLIEASNSSIRDNLARFNRRSKRFSKTHQMLAIILDLFFNRHSLSPL